MSQQIPHIVIIDQEIKILEQLLGEIPAKFSLKIIDFLREISKKRMQEVLEKDNSKVKEDSPTTTVE